MAVPVRNARETREIAPARPSLAIPGTVALLVCIVGLLVAYIQSIAAQTAVPVAAAIALEAGLYVVPGLERLRRGLEARFSRRGLALALAASAVVPYLVYSIPTGQFAFPALAGVAALALAASFWYVAFPKRPAFDLAFLALVASPVLLKAFGRIYTSPGADLRLDFLGQLMWIRLAAMSVLSLRGGVGAGFGFLPTAREWRVGIAHFTAFVPVAVAVGMGTGLMSFHPREAPWWINIGVAAGTFLGMLWVVALSEEFFFRGLLQGWLTEWTRRRLIALAIASAVFGAAHLPFRGFPNWRFALVAAIAGLFYGAAYLRTGSIRSAMVAHALTNTVWRMLFRMN